MQTRLSRRDFLRFSVFSAAATALWACGAEAGSPAPASTPTPSASGEPVDPLIPLTLRRITFGPRPEDIERAAQIGLDNFIDEQLAPEAIDDPDLEARLSRMTTLDMPPAELLRLEPPGLAARELMNAAILRAVYSRRQLYEQMVAFWSDHFNIFIGRDADRVLKTVDDREVIRPHALGRFSDLLSASAHSPAMLVYLDNAVSTKERPNENYARELMELHTLGVDGGYTHTDVEEVARALTGWSVNREREAHPGEFVYRPKIHDDGEKTILGVRFPAGQGIRDGEMLLEMLAEHPSTARYVSWKLARRFVADDPPAALVERLAATFARTRGDITALVSELLHSDEFRLSLGGKVKRPFDFVVSALRQTAAESEAGRPILYMLGQMGQQPFVWPTPDGYPEAASAWLNSNDLLARWNFALALAAGALKGTKVDWTALAPSAQTIEEVLDALSLRLLGGPLPEETRVYLLDLLSTWEVGDPFDYAQGKPFDYAQGKPFDYAQGKPFDYAQGKPFDYAQGKPFDYAQGKPFDYAQGKPFDYAQGKPFDYAQGKPFDYAQGKPFDYAQGKPFDYAQGKPFDYAQGRPFDYAQGRAAMALAALLIASPYFQYR